MTHTTSHQRAADRDDSLDDLADVLGLDPQVFTRAAKPGSGQKRVSGRRAESPGAVAADDIEAAAEPYVTVVVQILVAKPKRKQPADLSNPSPEPPRKRTGKAPGSQW